VANWSQRVAVAPANIVDLTDAHREDRSRMRLGPGAVALDTDLGHPRPLIRTGGSASGCPRRSKPRRHSSMIDPTCDYCREEWGAVRKLHRAARPAELEPDLVLVDSLSPGPSDPPTFRAFAPNNYPRRRTVTCVIRLAILGAPHAGAVCERSQLVGPQLHALSRSLATSGSPLHARTSRRRAASPDDASAYLLDLGWGTL